MTVAKGNVVGAGTGTGRTGTVGAIELVVEAPETERRRSKHLMLIPTTKLIHWPL